MPWCLAKILEMDVLKPLFIPVSNYLSLLLSILLSGPSDDVSSNGTYLIITKVLIYRQFGNMPV